MKWLREHGCISNLEDYRRLPMPVLVHARLCMEAEFANAKKQHDAERRANRARR